MYYVEWITTPYDPVNDPDCNRTEDWESTTMKSLPEAIRFCDQKTTELWNNGKLPCTTHKFGRVWDTVWDEENIHHPDGSWKPGWVQGESLEYESN